MCELLEIAKLEWYTLFSCRASKIQLGQHYVLHIIPKRLKSTKKIAAFGRGCGCGEKAVSMLFHLYQNYKILSP